MVLSLKIKIKSCDGFIHEMDPLGASVRAGDRRPSPPQLRLPVLLLRMAAVVAILMATATLATATAVDKDSEQLRFTSTAVTTDSVSGCGLCARSGQCEHAFRGAPGQFCLTLVSGAPCCCPADAQCVLANAYNCRCRRSVGVNGNGAHVRPHAATTAGSVLLGLLLACCGCCCCCCCVASRRRQRRDERGYYTEPLYSASATTQYGTNTSDDSRNAYPVAQALPVYPYAYASAPPEYDDSRYEPSKRAGDDNSNAFTAAALGAAGGLATGVFLGSAFGGRGGSDAYQQSSTSYFDGDTGGGFGFSGGPDVSASTVEFSGDTGGDDGGWNDNTGGGDDGGDFAGDS